MKVTLHARQSADSPHLNIQLSFTQQEAKDSIAFLQSYKEMEQLTAKGEPAPEIYMPKHLKTLFVEVEDGYNVLNPLFHVDDMIAQLENIVDYYENREKINYVYFCAPSKEVFDLVNAPLFDMLFAENDKWQLEATVESENPFTGEVTLNIFSKKLNMSYPLHLETPSELYEGHIPLEKDFQFYSLFPQALGTIVIELHENIVKSYFFNKITYQQTCVVYHY